MKLITQYMEAEVNTHYINLLCLMHEIDLFKNWAPMVGEGRIVKKATPNREMGVLQYNPPWPLGARESVLEGSGFIWKK